MKKLFSFILCLVLVLALSSCTLMFTRCSFLYDTDDVSVEQSETVNVDLSVPSSESEKNASLPAEENVSVDAGDTDVTPENNENNVNDGETSALVSDTPVTPDNSDSDTTENGASYSPGVLTSLDWKSAWIGLQYTLTDGFEMFSQQELEAMMQIGADYFYKDPETGEEQLDYAKINMIYEMQAKDAVGNNIIVAAEKLDPLITSEELYYEILILQFKQQTNINITFEDPVSYSLGGKAFLRMDGVQTVSGITVYQSYLIKKYDDRMVLIIVSLNDFAKLNPILSSFAPYSE